MVLSVTLHFRGGTSLTKKTDLLLTFDKQDLEGMYTIYNPVVWRVTSFPAGGGGSFSATYTADLAFTRAQIDSGVVQPASYSAHIDVLEQTTLSIDDPSPPPTYKFSKPVPWSGAKSGEFACNNQTGDYQNIGVGFFQEGHHDPTTSLVLNAVVNNTSAAAKFTPTLSAYVIAGYEKNQIIEAQIQGGLNWSLDLTKFGIQNSWILEESREGYTLVPDSPPE